MPSRGEGKISRSLWDKITMEEGSKIAPKLRGIWELILILLKRGNHPGKFMRSWREAREWDLSVTEQPYECN